MATQRSDECVKVLPLNDEHRLDIGIALGLSAAVNYLRAQTEEGFDKLPGFNTAIACAEMLEAQHRASVAGANFRAAKAAGVDISTHTIGMRGRGEIFADPMDLTERALFAVDQEQGK